MNLNGVNVIISPDIKRQRRKHKKRRINKKWLKRYGCIITKSPIEDYAAIYTPLGLVVNERTYAEITRLTRRAESDRTESNRKSKRI